MDYLSKTHKQTAKKSDCVLNKKNNLEISTNDFCKNVLDAMSADKKMEMCQKFITKEFIDILNNDALLQCINALFINNLNLSETSRYAFMHRNTLLYRIEKINRLVGLNIKYFDDAMFFKILMFLYYDMKEKLKKNEEK